MKSIADLVEHCGDRFSDCFDLNFYKKRKSAIRRWRPKYCTECGFLQLVAEVNQKGFHLLRDVRFDLRRAEPTSGTSRKYANEFAWPEPNPEERIGIAPWIGLRLDFLVC